jgi:hypothetical protein
MFSVNCPEHDAMVLLGTRSIEDLQVTTSGIHLVYRCTCGHQGRLHTGRHHTQSESVADETER